MPTIEKNPPKYALDFVDVDPTGPNPARYLDATGTAFIVQQLSAEEVLNASPDLGHERRLSVEIHMLGSASAASPRRVRGGTVSWSTKGPGDKGTPGDKTADIPELRQWSDEGESARIWSEAFASRLGERGIDLSVSNSKYNRTVQWIGLITALAAAQKAASKLKPTAPKYGDRLRFRQLADEWTRGTIGQSVLRLAVLHPAYQRIISMGPVAIPLLLEELRDRPDHWMWALSILADEDPAPEARTFAAARVAWLRWGGERGYLGAD